MVAGASSYAIRRRGAPGRWCRRRCVAKFSKWFTGCRIRGPEQRWEWWRPGLSGMKSWKTCRPGPAVVLGVRQQRCSGITGHRFTSLRERPPDLPMCTSTWWERYQHREGTVIDRFTRWPEAIPLAQTDTASVGRAFVLHWITRFGVPADITSDRGPQFTSEIWRALAESLGVKVHTTTAYHPQANGLLERFHRSLKAALRARLTTAAWMDELPWVMLGLRTAPKEDLGTSVVDMVYGTPLTVPGTFVAPSNDPEASDHLQRLRDIAGRLVPAPDAWHGTRATANTKTLREAEFVFVRRDAAHGPLQTPYTGPYRVLQRQEKYFVIQCGKREESVSVDRLKAANAEPDRAIEPAKPRRRGRPPKQRQEGPADDKEDPANTRTAADKEGPAETRPEQEQRTPTYAQVTRRGRLVRLPERYIATTTKNPQATTD